ncbi:MAG: hypothetical protein HY744_04420 [Deltaproteobacteria bacterium]|nr:hypothetical protein [Deltaproteobacteria bacterium]
MLQRLLRLSVLGIVLLAAAVLQAHGPYWPPPRSRVTAELVDQSGRQLPTFYQRGETFVLGHDGQRYDVRVHNQGPGRVEVVVMVDGRDAIGGKLGDAAGRRGYVVPAYGSVLVQGFRTSLSSVASFRFTDPESSYSGRLGTPHLAGVVRVAVFGERQPEPPPVAQYDDDEYPWYGYRPPPGARRSSPSAGAGPAPADRSARRAEGEESARRDRVAPWSSVAPREPGSNLGTEYGEQRHSRVVEVSFVRANPSRPSQWITLRYDDEQGLEARGIIVRRPPPPPPPPLPPLPFYYEPESSRFAPPPPPRVRPWYAPID